MEAECKHTGDCAGTCPKCDAEIRYLDAELNRKVLEGEQVTVATLSADKIAQVLGCDSDDSDFEELVSHGDGYMCVQDGVDEELPFS